MSSPSSSSSLALYDANVLLAAVAALSGAVAFVAALHLYARCLLQRRIALAEANPRVLVLRRPPPAGYELDVVVNAGGGCGQGAAGLDAKALLALPVFMWESSKLREGGVGAAEHDGQCAVCLGEMEDGELGRLLPACRHAFHVECIDTWLRVSSTCPVCRTVAAAAPAATLAVAPGD
jgi:E3 ubiquitin-protein ligase ATL41